MKFIFDIYPTASVIVLILMVLILAYKLKGKFPIGCAVVCIAFVVFTVKTCRELVVEEALEQKRSEQIWKKIQEDKREREERKRERLKEVTIEEYIISLTFLTVF